MNMNQRLKAERKQRIEEEKHFAIYKLYNALGMLTLYEDCNLSEKTVQKFMKGMRKKNDEYCTKRCDMDDLALRLLKHGILVENINCDKEGNVLPEYEGKVILHD